MQVSVANALCSDVQWQSPELITCMTTPVDSYQQGPVVLTLITGGVATSVHQFQYPNRTRRSKCRVDVPNIYKTSAIWSHACA